MKVYTNIVDVISLCVPAGGRAGAACVWFPLWCRGVGWGGTLCVNVRAKPRRNVAALRPPRSQGGLCFGGRVNASSFHISVIILSPIHPKKKRKEDYKKETDTLTHTHTQVLHGEAPDACFIFRLALLQTACVALFQLLCGSSSGFVAHMHNCDFSFASQHPQSLSLAV